MRLKSELAVSFKMYFSHSLANPQPTKRELADFEAISLSCSIPNPSRTTPRWCTFLLFWTAFNQLVFNLKVWYCTLIETWGTLVFFSCLEKKISSQLFYFILIDGKIEIWKVLKTQNLSLIFLCFPLQHSLAERGINFHLTRSLPSTTNMHVTVGPIPQKELKPCAQTGHWTCDIL